MISDAERRLALLHLDRVRPRVECAMISDAERRLALSSNTFSTMPISCAMISDAERRLALESAQTPEDLELCNDL